MKGARAILHRRRPAGLRGAGVLIEEKVDGDDVTGLATAVAIAGGALAGFAGYVTAREDTSAKDD